MRWTPGGVSGDIEDRRGAGGGFGFGGGGLRLGLGGMLLLFVLSLIFGRNFFALLDPSAGTAPASSQADRVATEGTDVQFVSFVLDDAQQTWHRLLPNRYENAKLVLFRDAVQSACGFAEAATGPFYCPGDRRVYLDLSFFQELEQRFGAPGDFARAYVIAHEIGHHVQNLLGIERRVRSGQYGGASPNELSVRMELQADCFAGVWGHSTEQRNILERGDVEEGLNAAAAVGDDRLQRKATGHVSPDSFTHGTSAQRAAWFRRGFESGDISACDTFSSRN